MAKKLLLYSSCNRSVIYHTFPCLVCRHSHSSTISLSCLVLFRFVFLFVCLFCFVLWFRFVSFRFVSFRFVLFLLLSVFSLFEFSLEYNAFEDKIRVFAIMALKSTDAKINTRRWFFFIISINVCLNS